MPDHWRLPSRTFQGLAWHLLHDKNRDWETRGGPCAANDYENTLWPFCFNVKLQKLDFSFDHLLNLYIAGNGRVSDQPSEEAAWAEKCRQAWQRVCGNDTQELYDWTIRAARRDFADYDVTDLVAAQAAPADPYWHSLADGTEVVGRFGFMGHSGGWLVLKYFDDIECNYHMAQTLQWISNGTYKPNVWYTRDYLQRLCRYLQQIADRVSGGNKLRKEIEAQAAELFFHHFCRDVRSPAMLRAEQSRNWRANLRFLQTFKGLQKPRPITPIKEE